MNCGIPGRVREVDVEGCPAGAVTSTKWPFSGSDWDADVIGGEPPEPEINEAAAVRPPSGISQFNEPITKPSSLPPVNPEHGTQFGSLEGALADEVQGIGLKVGQHGFNSRPSHWDIPGTSHGNILVPWVGQGVSPLAGHGFISYMSFWDKWDNGGISRWDIINASPYSHP
jgi:hypothetical protein